MALQRDLLMFAAKHYCADDGGSPDLSVREAAHVK